MIVQMSGGRYDDRSWPTPWVDFEVPDEEGRGLIRCGAAMEVVGTPETAAEPAQEPAPEPVVPAAPAWEGLPSSSNDPAPVPAPAMAKTAIDEAYVPVPADPKAAWVEYAVSRGASQGEAEGMTKAQLQAAYGGRM